MRNMTLVDMLADLRVEARISPNVAHGVHQTQGYKTLLRRIQEELYDAHDWPMLDHVADVEVLADERFKTYPETFTFNGIRAVHYRPSGGKWEQLTYGIGVDQLNAVDSAAGETRERAYRWQHYVSPAAEQINQNMLEIWPVPSKDGTLRFEGKRALLPLTEDGHTSTLDGPLIVLHAAAEILAGQKAEDATLKVQKAQARFDFIKRRASQANNDRVNFARRTTTPRLRRGIDYVE